MCVCERERNRERERERETAEVMPSMRSMMKKRNDMSTGAGIIASAAGIT